MISDIAGDVSRCIQSRKSFLEGKSKQDYSSFWLQRIIESCNSEDVSCVIPDIKDELQKIRDYLDGKGDSEAILAQWKKYELLEWDPDFTKETEEEKHALDEADAQMKAGEYVSEDEVWSQMT